MKKSNDIVCFMLQGVRSSVIGEDIHNLQYCTCEASNEIVCFMLQGVRSSVIGQ